MSSHRLLTLPIHPALFDPGAAAFDDNDVSCERLCRSVDVDDSVAVDEDGRESASLERRRKLEWSDRGELSWIASARTSGLSEMGDTRELRHSSSAGSSSESAESSDDAEDCESRWLGVEADEVVAVETELTLSLAACFAAAFFIAAADASVARDTVAKPEIGTAGGDDDSGAERSRPAASSRTPCLMAVLAVGRIDDPGNEGDTPGVLCMRLVVSGVEYARSMPRLTMRSHLRFRSASSASCMASCERSSMHLDSFCAMNCRRSACLRLSHEQTLHERYIAYALLRQSKGAVVH